MVVIRYLHTLKNHHLQQDRESKLKRILAVAFFATLQACSTFEAIPEGYTGPISTISDTYNYVSNTKIHIFELSKIDGRKVRNTSYRTRLASDGLGFSLNPVVEKRDVPFSKSQLTIQGSTYFAAPILGLGGGAYKVEGVVDIELEEGETYYVKGELSENTKKIWVQDFDGNIVSEIIESGK